MNQSIIESVNQSVSQSLSLSLICFTVNPLISKSVFFPFLPGAMAGLGIAMLIIGGAGGATGAFFFFK